MAMTGGTAKLVAQGTPPRWPGPISLYAYYREDSQSVENNETELSLGMYVTTPTGWYFGPWSDFYGSYIGTETSGDNCKAFNGACPANTQVLRWLVEDQKVTVKHNEDGRKTATIYWHWGVNSGWSGVMNNPSGSFTVELTTIPRATIVDEVTSVNGFFTNALNCLFTPKSADYYNRLYISLKKSKATFTVIRTMDLGQQPDAQQNRTLKFTDAELETIYNTLPSSASGTLRFIIDTYYDAEYSKQVGTRSYKEITLNIPQVANSMGSQKQTCPIVLMSLEPVTELGGNLASLYIQGKSKVKANITASGMYGATIEGCSMKVEGVTYGEAEDFTSGYLTNHGLVRVAGYATDSRGFSNSAPAEVYVIHYSKPKILPVTGEDEVVAARCDATGNPTDSGTYLQIRAKRSYSPVKSGGVQKNFCQLRYRYKLKSAEEYSDWAVILAGDSLDSDEIVTGALLGGVLSAKSTYLVQIQAVDDVGETAETTITVPTETVYMHRAKNAMGLGKYVERENLLDVAWDTQLRGEVLIGEDGVTLRDYILAVISEGG